MRKLNKINFYRMLVWCVIRFHEAWIFMLLFGAMYELFWNPEYAKIEICIIVATALFQLSGRGRCPLTTWENQLWGKIDPSKVYWDPETHNASFIKHYGERFTGKKLPKSTTLGLLVVVCTVTVLVLIF